MKIKEQVKNLLRCNNLFLTFLISAMILNVSSLKSQESAVKLYPSLGISFGFFNPKDVNSFIKHDLSSNSIIATGTSDIFMYYDLHGGLTLRIKWLDINGFLEYALAPKWIIVTNGSSRTYFFNRTTFGATSNFYIPLGEGRHAIFFGGGVHYNILTFKNYSASKPGFRIQAGASFQFGKLNIQPYTAFNYVKAIDISNTGDFVMNYTGGQIGVMLSFHSGMKYK
jgi:hypothetical protein